ncbi:MAG: hypothetical protein IKX14_00570 [Neisseriaceae bacterium]|nr:hypothetical protein [Neisseriaceae bacterium]
MRLAEPCFRRRQTAVSDLSLTAVSLRECVALVAITTPDFGQARNDELVFKLPENMAKVFYNQQLHC